MAPQCPAPQPLTLTRRRPVCVLSKKLSGISDAKREAAECRRAGVAETNPNVSRQLLLIADAWDTVIRAHEENVRRLTRETLLGVAARWDRLAEQARKESRQT